MCLLLAATAVQAAPGSKPAALVGATEKAVLTAPSGFIDDAIEVDAKRAIYTVSEASTKSEIHIYTFATKADQVIDISTVTLHPTELHVFGNTALVIGSDGDQLIGGAVELADRGRIKAGTVIYKLPPATHITYLGKRGIAVHRAAAAGESTRHEIELLSANRGRRIGARRTLVLDASGREPKLDFRVNHWSDGWTRAHGIKGGEWNRKENQRSPDTEATYDVLTGRWVERKKITDLFQQRKRFQALAVTGGQLDFVHFTWDNQTLRLWHAGTPENLDVDQALATYDPKSLQSTVRDGSAWFALTVDPVNPDAVNRKKADPVYLDVFQITGTKATRRARVFAKDTRYRFGTTTDGKGFYLLKRNSSMDRGGKSLTIYDL